MHGSGALAPSRQYEPGLQAMHVWLPSSGWYVPAAHRLHTPMLALGATVPGLHGVMTYAPVEQKWPAGHGRQSAALVIEMLSRASVAFSYRPAGHGSPADAPSAQ